MKFHHLANLMYNWGWQIKIEQYIAFSDYLKDMLKKNRVFVIYDGELIIAVVMYFLTDDYNKVYKKKTWETVSDNPEGHQMYIDKLVAKEWNPTLRKAVQMAIQEKFPQVKTAYYHRAPKDRLVTIMRRDINVLQSTVS